jgi:outer membrane protein assembly factor BamA
VNPTREEKRKLKRDAKFELKHQRWERAPNLKSHRKRKEPKKHSTIGEFLYKIGEPPVLLDTSKTSRTKRQLSMYLDNKGYFNSIVEDTLVYPWFQRNKHKKAIECYIIKPSIPYTIKDVTWEIKDPGIAYQFFNEGDTAGCKLIPGDNCDVDNFEAERDRITSTLRNDGYFLFTKDYIRFTMDTTAGSHQAHVQIIISRQQFKTSDSTWIETDHQRFYIRNIIVKNFTAQGLMKEDTMRYDTVVYHETDYLRNIGYRRGIPIEKKMKFKPEVLSPRIAFHPSILYREGDYDATYRQLTGLHVFRQVVVDPEIVESDKLDVYVKLFPIPRQNFVAQLEGTNSGGNFGVVGSFSYNNNNLFHGAEILQFKIKSGAEAQQAFGSTTTNTPHEFAFNTISLGEETSLIIPREFFPFGIFVRNNRREEDRQAQERRTVFNSVINIQRRIDYDRSLVNVAYGYTFRYKTYCRIGIFPIELNVVKVKPKAGLDELLANGDPLLRYRFTDHFIDDARITFIYNTQSSDPNQKFVKYFKLDAEMSGFFLYGFSTLTNQPTDTSGHYRVGNIPFSNYVRFAGDWHWHWRIGDHETFVVRAAGGYGLPLWNYPTLPLEKSFYGGGANGIRAWEARTLGPGSYQVPADERYAQLGDVQLEYNIELRVKITNSLNAAVFADGGNIWILKKDETRPGAEFDPTRFINDLAFGPGAGLRYDLGFFIIRLDWAFKIRDPSYPFGERWWLPGRRPLSGNINFGIGYPF